MSDEDPLSDEYLKHHTPGSSGDGWGEPRPVDQTGFKKEKREARAEYQDLLDSNRLDTTIESEGKFLAKMYIVAEHFGEVERFKRVLKRGMYARPDKVSVAAEIFHSLALIYYAVGEHAEKYWEDVRYDHLVGKGPEAYQRELLTITKYIYRQKLSLYDVAENTNDLTGKFAGGLRRWQNQIAEAIKTMAEHDRNKYKAAVWGWASSLITADPYAVAKETLDLLINLFDESVTHAEEEKKLLDKIAMPEGFGLKDVLLDDVDYHGLVMPDPWDGKLR